MDESSRCPWYFDVPVYTLLVVPPPASRRQVVPWLAVDRIVILVGLVVAQLLRHSVKDILDHDSLQTDEHHVDHHEQAALCGLVDPSEPVIRT